MKAHEFSVLGPLMGGFGSQAFLGCLHAEDGLIKPAVMVFLSDEIVDGPDLFRRVWAETELGTQIDHVNVIGVMGIAKLDEGFARVVEYADAESMRSVFRRATTLKKALPPDIACAIVADACMGVHYAYELGASESGEGWVHGGIRPETLQVSFQGMAKVTGYGATTIAEVMRKSRGTDAKDAYTAPEQTYGGRAAATMQTDVYALGCVLYEALTGKAPFAADNDLAEAMIKDELDRRVQDEAGGVTEVMAQIVLRATKKKSAERYGSALEMRHELKEGVKVADERAVRRFMDELYPPDTVPRATRDQMLIAAREKPPAPTGRLLTQIPPEIVKPTKVRTSLPSDAEVEAAQGVRVERPVERPVHQVAERAAPLSDRAAPTTPPVATDPTGEVPGVAPAPASPASAISGPTAETPTATAGDIHDAETHPPTDAVPRKSRKHVSPSGNARVSAAYVSSAPQPAATATTPPVVYRTPPGLLIALGLAAGVAVALVIVFAMKDDPPPQVVVQAPPPPPPPPVALPPPPPPPPEPPPPPPPVDTPRPKGKTGKQKPPSNTPAPVDDEPKTGRFAFDQLPDGVDVFLDGKKLGRTPLPAVTVSAGRHQLKVQKGTQVIPYKVNLPAGREMYITASFGE